eukprot:jgi/Chlat1/8852/Chrsp91S08186
MSAPGTPPQLVDKIDDGPQWGSRSVDVFEKLEQIGEGTYGQVYMAREKATGDIVALKKVRMDNEKEGFPITAIREIKILKSLQHENVIRLKEIVTGSSSDKKEGDKLKEKGVSIYMVFEYMDHDLTGLADRPDMRFSVPQIKCYLKQLLTGLHYCHKNNVLHRDIKGSNLLINNQGVLKLADFGLARPYATDGANPLTNRVITLWYRPPELLLGATKYGPAVDLWSVGCIFAELVLGRPLLPGKNEMEQLNKIFQLCGSPTEENWPGVSKLPWYHMFKPERPFKRRIREEFANCGHEVVILIDKLLCLNPDKRISALEALGADYFWHDPMPCDPHIVPQIEASHEFQTKKRRQQLKQAAEQAKRQKMQPPSAPLPVAVPPPQQGYPQRQGSAPPQAARQPQMPQPYHRPLPQQPYQHRPPMPTAGYGGYPQQAYGAMPPANMQAWHPYMGYGAPGMYPPPPMPFPGKGPPVSYMDVDQMPPGMPPPQRQALPFYPPRNTQHPPHNMRPQH